MNVKTDYSTEIQTLFNTWYTPVKSIDDVNPKTIKKTLADLHQDITNVLPSKWIDQSDVYNALIKQGSIPLPCTNEANQTTFYYCFQPK